MSALFFKMKSFALVWFLIVPILCKDPGLPVPNPSISYWQLPPNKHVSDHQSEQLPTDVDVVIIGSGISGTSIAKHLLQNGDSLKVAMLEARQACSGATGRNGGHIRPSSYAEYADGVSILPKEEAAKITRLRAAHVEALIAAANELDDEGREASEARSVDSIDAFFDQESFASAKAQLAILQKEVPDLGAEWKAWEKDDARRISLLVEAEGILTGTAKIAGAIWPYRFVTHTLKALLQKYPTFSLDTNTPALNVTSITDDATEANFQVSTPRGDIRTRHVVYAANAWIPHFVPGLDGKITGGRLTMSAQLGGTGLPKAGQWPPYTANGSLSTGRAWSLYRNGLDYIVQMPKNGEYMFGGGLVGGGFDGERARPGQAGNSSQRPPFPEELDDSVTPDHTSASYLNGALPSYFGYERYGQERTDFPQATDTRIWKGRTKRVWVGIEGGAFDGRPFVGRLPTSATLREVRNATTGGEWISAAFDGEGMCFAWLSGQAMSEMLLEHDAAAGIGGGNHSVPAWFPQSFLITEARLNASTESSRIHHIVKRQSRLGRAGVEY